MINVGILKKKNKKKKMFKLNKIQLKFLQNKSNFITKA